MKKTGSSSKKTGAKGSRAVKAGVTIGRQRFAKISAVEGIHLSREMTARADEFERRGSSAEERRTAIIRAYRKS